MITPKILIIGSTGILGLKIIKYLNDLNVPIETATCFNNLKLLKKLKVKFNIKRTFCLNQNKSNDYSVLLNHVRENKYDIVYILDTELNSIPLIQSSLKFQKNCVYATANKELVIAGGKILINLINKNNIFLPLDSEHFSLIDITNYEIDKIKKVYITASGGPFYFTKKKLKNVKLKEVIKHPKWKMGKDICINSSNFINKAFEILELSTIFGIPLNKIDILLSKEALVHSVVSFTDGRYTFNIFNNDMLIPLIKPLEKFNLPTKINNKIDLSLYKNFKLAYPKNDIRFPLLKKIKLIKTFNHSQQILFLILNKKAHNLYLSDKLRYNQIVNYIFSNMSNYNYKYNLLNLDDIIKYYKKCSE